MEINKDTYEHQFMIVITYTFFIDISYIPLRFKL